MSDTRVADISSFQGTPDAILLDSDKRIIVGRAIESITLGHANSNIIGDNHLRWRTINMRQEDQQHVEDLVSAFTDKGILHKDPLPIMIRSSWISNDPKNLPKKFDRSNWKSLEKLALTEDGKKALSDSLIECHNGYHRCQSRAVARTKMEKQLGTPETPISQSTSGLDESEYARLLQVYQDLENFPFILINLGEFNPQITTLSRRFPLDRLESIQVDPAESNTRC